MSQFKFLRLTVSLCGALMLVNAPTSFAQDAVAVDTATAPIYPAPATTPEAAGERFYQLLSAGASSNNASAPFDIGKVLPYAGAISRAQVEKISAVVYNGDRNVGLAKLFDLMAQQKDEPQYEAKVVGKEGEQTFVEVAPAPAKKRSVVVIAEDGGYRVDIKATFGRWNDLSGEKLDISWADFTGIVSPGLATNTTYVANKARSSCQVNLKQAMLGILQYSQDYNETFPTARKWVDNVMPYVRSEQIFRCPALPEGSNYGYALNQNLDGLQMAKMDNVAQTVAIYETSDLTRNAFGVADERAYRHLGGSNIAFADGHIKWFAEGKEPKESVSFKP